MIAPESVAEAREVDLLPCPFCGEQPTFFDAETRKANDFAGGALIECPKCNATVDGDTNGATIAAWNTRTPVPTATHYAALKEAAEALRALVTAVTFADPPKLFNGVICHEARVPVEFIDNARAALEQSK